MAVSRKVEREMLRTKYVDMLVELLAYNNEEVLRVKSNEIAIPVVGCEDNEDFVVITVKVPTGANKGMEPYDGYSEAESYELKLKEKERKAKEKEEKKKKKIARDEEIRRKKKEIADEEKATEQKKAEIIKTCIQAVEQMHKGLEGAKKLAACIDGARQMLSTAGIEVSDFELKMRIESQLAEFNKIFESGDKE